MEKQSQEACQWVEQAEAGHAGGFSSDLRTLVDPSLERSWRFRIRRSRSFARRAFEMRLRQV
jgi:phage baseplate assembly protein W